MAGDVTSIVPVGVDGGGELALGEPDEFPSPVPHFAVGSPPLVRLYSTGALQYVEHILTGECIELPEVGSARWAIRSDDEGWDYVACPGQKPLWLVERFKTALWKKGGGFFVQTESIDDDTVITVWMSELKEKYTWHCMQWSAGEHHYAVGRLAYVVLAVPRAYHLFFSMCVICVSMSIPGQACVFECLV